VPGERADASSKKSATRVSLPDLLRHGLDLVFVGINPSVYSAIQGHYFARKINRFWPAFSRSRLSEPARLALGVDRLEPEHDAALLAYGIGFTDAVDQTWPNAVVCRSQPESGQCAFLSGGTDRMV
jgi:mismatch-specific thymine-DNA glycosylase